MGRFGGEFADGLNAAMGGELEERTPAVDARSNVADVAEWGYPHNRPREFECPEVEIVRFVNLSKYKLLKCSDSLQQSEIKVRSKRLHE